MIVGEEEYKVKERLFVKRTLARGDNPTEKNKLKLDHGSRKALHKQPQKETEMGFGDFVISKIVKSREVLRDPFAREASELLESIKRCHRCAYKSFFCTQCMVKLENSMYVKNCTNAQGQKDKISRLQEKIMARARKGTRKGDSFDDMVDELLEYTDEIHRRYEARWIAAQEKLWRQKARFTTIRRSIPDDVDVQRPISSLETLRQHYDKSDSYHFSYHDRLKFSS
mgnify:CR=1 FL=1